MSNALFMKDINGLGCLFQLFRLKIFPQSPEGFFSNFEMQIEKDSDSKTFIPVKISIPARKLPVSSQFRWAISHVKLE